MNYAVKFASIFPNLKVLPMKKFPIGSGALFPKSLEKALCYHGRLRKSEARGYAEHISLEQTLTCYSIYLTIIFFSRNFIIKWVENAIVNVVAQTTSS